MNQFKVGDTVVCVNDKGLLDLNLGEKYTVSGLEGSVGVYLETEGNLCWYYNERFKLAESNKPDFCMKTQPWFIRVNNEEEWTLAVEFARSKGIDFYLGNLAPYYKSLTLITNIDTGGCMPGHLMHGTACGTKNEIKLSYKTVLDKVDYPEVKSEQQLEIEKIEAEMMKLQAETRKLADRLNDLKTK